MVYCAGIAPENILTLTYTIAAARDMKNRFRFYFGDRSGSRLEFRTINGICALRGMGILTEWILHRHKTAVYRKILMKMSLKEVICHNCGARIIATTYN